MIGLRDKTIIAAALGALLAVKMVAFEPTRPALLGMRIEIVAVLLPLALPLGWRGVVALGVGCGMAHAIHGTGILEGLASGTAVALSLATVHVAVRRPWDLTGILGRCLSLAALLALTLGVAFAVQFSVPVSVAVAGTFVNVVLPVALGGPAALVLALRITRLRDAVLEAGAG